MLVLLMWVTENISVMLLQKLKTMLSHMHGKESSMEDSLAIRVNSAPDEAN